jgi:hypothetical protein
MGPFSVLHINKYKALGGIGSHIDRRHIVANVDPLRSHLNEDSVYVFSKEMTLEKSVSNRISEGYTKSRAIRKDAVKALGIIMGGSHERMKEIESDVELFRAWKKANYDFVCREFGRENIVRFSLHRDEKTPHFHCVVVPITLDGKLSADHFIGTPAKLRAYQDRYAEIMKKFGLLRGIHKELTRREHVTSKEYYKTINALAHEVEALTENIKRSNVLKLDKIREDLKEHIIRLKVKAMEQETQYRYAMVSNQTIAENYSKRSFERQFEQESDQAYSWIKREIPLADFAVSKLGWRLLKDKSTKSDLVLEHPTHGKIIVPTRPKSSNGHWVYSIPNQKSGGTLIDLLRQDKWDWKAIKGLAHGYITTPITELIPRSKTYSVARHVESPERQEALAQRALSEVKVKQTATETYLEKRGISRATYELFPQLRTNSQQAIFGLYSGFDSCPRLCSTINYYFDREDNSRKYFQKDLPRGLAKLSLSTDSTHIVIAESPIDALSHRQLQIDSGIVEDRKHLDKTMYFATCGNLSVEILRSLENIFEQANAKNQEIILAFDNDISGRKMTKELERLLQEKQCKYRVDVPELGKDWNESLYIQSRDYAVQDFLAQDKLYGFPQVKYEASILHKVGVPQSECDGIQIKAEERSVIFGLHQDITAGKRLCSTVQYKWDQSGTERKYFQASLPRGLSMFSPRKEVKHIFIMDSPLEAMQHRRGNSQSDHTLYLCTCGSLTKGLQKELSQVFYHAKEKGYSISLGGLDDQSLEQLTRMLKETKCVYKVLSNPIETMGIHTLLSKVAYTLRTFSSINSGITRGDEEEEEEVKKSKNKGKRR